MATDKLINKDQGDSMITALGNIATNINTITYGPQTSADKVVSMTGYQKSSATDPGAISQGDSLNEAVGKLEKKVDNNATAITGKIESYTDATTSGHVVTFNNSTGTQVTDSGVSIATSTTGVTDVDTTIPTSKSVVAYAATKSHTHDYAGSGSPGGAATSADKLNIGSSNIGSTTQPVYFDKTTGQPVAITNTIQSNVPADAVFTDTTYTVATGTQNGKIKVTPSVGSAYEVPVYGLGNAAYKGVADTVSSSTDLVTSNAVNTKLASYVPNSDLVEVVDNGAKNLLHFEDSNTVIGNFGGFLINGLNAITVFGKAAWAKSVTSVPLSPDTYELIFTIDSTDVNMSIDIHNESNNTNYYHEAFTATGTIAREFTIPSGVSPDVITFRVCCNNSSTAQTDTVTSKISNVMICTKAQFDISNKYEPYALGNQVLTPELIELCDSGAKQLAQGQNNSGSAGTATIQSDGYTVKLTGSAASSSSLSFATTGTIQKTGTYVFAIEASGTMDRISIWDNTTSASIETLYATGSKEVTLTAGHSYALFHFAGSAMTLNATVKYMLCTKAAFGVSSKFVPYRPNWDLVCDSVPTLKRIAYWTSTFTIPIKPFAESTGGYMYKIYVNGGNPGELGVYLITGSLVTDIKAHSKVSYTVNEGTSVVFNATSTVVAYYELIKFPST